MRKATFIFLMLSAITATSSCRHISAENETDRRIDILEERINQLEQYMYRYDDNPNHKDDSGKRSASTTQCKATTKKGTRCKRMVKSGSYCWQHQH